MADFSKQYCELYDPEFPWDFDIEEIAKGIHTERYYPIICEGFGFSYIGKNAKGDILLGFPKEDDRDWINWIKYEDFMISETNKYLSEIDTNHGE